MAVALGVTLQHPIMSTLNRTMSPVMLIVSLHNPVGLRRGLG